MSYKAIQQAIKMANKGHKEMIALIREVINADDIDPFNALNLIEDILTAWGE